MLILFLLQQWISALHWYKIRAGVPGKSLVGGLIFRIKSGFVSAGVACAGPKSTGKVDKQGRAASSADEKTGKPQRVEKMAFKTTWSGSEGAKGCIDKVARG